MARTSRSTKPAASGRSSRDADTAAPTGRVAQMRAVWSMTRQADPRMPLLVLGPAIAVLVVLVVVGILISHVVLFTLLGLVGAVLVGTTIFGRRATASMYAQVEGRPGAAAAVLQGMRGDWRVTPAVAFTRNQDLVHRVVGRPGVVLVAEGSSVAAMRQLLTDQKRRIGRVAPDAPVHEFLVGDGDGMLPVRKLQPQLMRLPRALRKGDVDGLESRMRAIGGTNVPLPKGPLPQRVPRRQR